jgi:YesN/AraC family two-component response regulator
MLIDDEIMVIEDLKSMLVWEEYGFKIVCETTISSEAIELYKKHRPDIIITDIWMPGINGLELSKKFLELDKSSKIILLTAYKDFEFAKFAVSLGVSNYMVKHEINKENLLKELQRIKGLINTEENRNQIVRKQLMKSLITNSYDFIAKNSLKEFFNMNNKNFLLFLYKIDTPYELIDNIYNTENIYFSDIFSENLNKVDEQILSVEVIQIDNLYGVFIIGLKKMNSKKQINYIISNLASQIQINFKKSTKNKTISIFTELKYLRIECLSHIYYSLKNYSEYLIFMGKEKIVFSENIKGLIRNDIVNSNDLYNKLKQEIKNSNLKEISKILTMIFDNTKSPYWNKEALSNTCKDLLYILDIYRKEANKTSIYYKVRTYNNSLSELYHIDKIKDWFINEFIYATRYITNYDISVYSRKVRKIIKYIKRHYNEDIIIEDVGNSIEISAIYLSQIFKKETDQTFLEYLTNYRIERAKDLLKNTNYKMYEISEMVGYKTSQYFSSVFKKIVGLSPLEYREEVK